jgi:glyoxylase-like metal-dependent hydrolase (beta-lactamase superfamily II)
MALCWRSYGGGMDLPARLTRVAITVGQCWLWRDGDEVTLIDSGPAGSGDRIAAALAELGLDRDAVVRVVLTHFHDDHAGSAAEVRSWAGAEVVAHVAEAPVVRGEVPGAPPDLLAVEEELLARVSAGLPAAPPCPVDREVVDGDVLAFAGGAHVVHGPGHTPGSIALHLPGPRVLFTGDTVAESAGTVLVGPFNQDRGQALESFRRVVAFDVDLALVGHGEPIGATALATAVPGPFAG